MKCKAQNMLKLELKKIWIFFFATMKFFYNSEAVLLWQTKTIEHLLVMENKRALECNHKWWKLKEQSIMIVNYANWMTSITKLRTLEHNNGKWNVNEHNDQNHNTNSKATFGC
jgi:hypothetical protein